MRKGRESMSISHKPNLRPSAQSLGHEAVQLLHSLAQFGSVPEGGITRLVYTPAWREAQAWLEREMTSRGLLTFWDDVGNLYGRSEPASPGGCRILTGSHVDTVRQGGCFDGAAGIVASLIAVSWLRATYGPPHLPLDVVSFAEEEGVRFPVAFWGSSNALAAAEGREPTPLPRVLDEDGIDIERAIRDANLPPASQRSRQPVGAYVELHVEQGSKLEEAGVDIGVVTAIVGQRRYWVEVVGRAGHAGTMSMQARVDAMACACSLLNELLERAAAIPDLTLTAGQWHVEPNAVNVIPGRVTFSLDVRHPSERQLDLFACEIESVCSNIAAERRASVRLTSWMKQSPVPMDPTIIALISSAGNDAGWSSMPLLSGAGHDAQTFAGSVPSGMIFVPSRGGVSHAPDEFTSSDALGRGIEVLIRVLYALAYETYLP